MDDLNINPHQRSILWLATAQRLPKPPRAAREVRSNMDVQAIKAKYLGDEFGMEVKVDVEALRSRALEALSEANRMVQQQKDNANRSDREPAMVLQDKEWQSRWKKRQEQGVAELRRSVKIATDMLSEVGAILGRAESRLKEVK